MTQDNELLEKRHICGCRLHVYDLYAVIQHAEIVRNVVKCYSRKYFEYVCLTIANLLAWSATLLMSVSNHLMATYGVPFLRYGSDPYYHYGHITEPSSTCFILIF